MSRIRVLFLCTGNSARSVIAEALLDSLGGADFEAFSAGTHPKGVNPFTVAVLEETGIDAARLRSKGVDAYLDQAFDYVITVCDDAAEECPVFPGAAERLHWSFSDPAAVEGDDGVRLAAFQATLRRMRRRLDSFMPAARQTHAPG